jgi:hypothetical protein
MVITGIDPQALEKSTVGAGRRLRRLAQRRPFSTGTGSFVNCILAANFFLTLPATSFADDPTQRYHRNPDPRADDSEFKQPVHWLEPLQLVSAIQGTTMQLSEQQTEHYF